VQYVSMLFHGLSHSPLPVNHAYASLRMTVSLYVIAGCLRYKNNGSSNHRL